MISASSNDVKPIDGKKPTEDFIYFALYLIIQEISSCIIIAVINQRSRSCWNSARYFAAL
jgi:hypothetical protein